MGLPSSGRDISWSIRMCGAEAERQNSCLCLATWKWGITGLVERSPICFWAELGLLFDGDTSL